MMTSLADLLLKETVFPRARWQGKRQVIAEFSAELAKAHGCDPRGALEALNERERLGSTGVGEGVAIPHARVAGLVRPVGGFARLMEPADFDAIDERRCDLIFMLLAPVDCGAEHLKALARVSRLFRQEGVRAALRKAQTEEDVFDVLCRNETSNAA